MAYFSCFDVTSVLHDRLSPPGIGFTTSINGDEGPEQNDTGRIREKGMKKRQRQRETEIERERDRDRDKR